MMSECNKEVQENDLKKEIGSLKTSAIRLSFRIILSIALTIFLIFSYDAILQMEINARTVLLWILALVVVILLGHLWTTSFLKIIRNRIYYYALKHKEGIEDIYVSSLSALPAPVVGVTERIFFGALVAFDISATAAAMVTWILVKMATDWHRILDSTKEGKKGPRALAFCSLLGSMISLFFALIGGLICRMALDP